MPKQSIVINQFHGGLNSSAARTDVAESELTEAIDVMVDKLGTVRNMGTTVAYNDLSKAVAINNGYGLFRFGHDRSGGNSGIEQLNGTQDVGVASISNVTGGDSGQVGSYPLIFSDGNLRSGGKKHAISHLLSKMKENKSFFNTDKILFKTFINKLKNSERDADDILYRLIISECLKQNQNKFGK